ncbi:hypothetical protein DFH29DRAFT_999497 [Suillus ampliporus]|nr:hypothetical protein DFH29DRAFT_999497 [Suillus ampliporus]
MLGTKKKLQALQRQVDANDQEVQHAIRQKEAHKKLRACQRKGAITRSDDPNDGIHLAVSPKCGPLSGPASDFNAGLNLPQCKTIVSFGDSFTYGGRHNGSPLEPAVLIPPNALAGGRSTNGPVWVEAIAGDIGAKVMDYAWSSAVTNISLWPSNLYPRDFVMQSVNDLDPETTLYTVFFGINDWEDSFGTTPHKTQTNNNQRLIICRV